MPNYRGAWSRDEVEAFLEDARIPIRLATHRPDETMWVVTLWFRYANDAIECATWANAKIVEFLRNDSEIGFDISTNQPPYRGVRGNGTTSLATDRDKTVLRALLERYFGDTDSELAEWLLDDEREEIRIRIRPREIYSWDYSERMKDIRAK